MEICILSEGSYPYISGGVSSWINQLVNEMNDKTFKIVSIMPSRESNLEYKYKIPSNITEIKTIYLNDYFYLEPNKKNKEPQLNKKELIEVEKFFRFDKNVDWNLIINIISNKKRFGNCVEFLQSRFFWNMILRFYQDNYNKEEFNKFFWTIRSMFIPFISIVQSELPKADIYHSVSTGYAGFLGLLCKIKNNKPFILTEHGIYAREREEEIIRAKWVTGIYKKIWIDFFYFISIGSYKGADSVVSLFERNKNIQLELGSNKEKTIVIPNGVDLNKFTAEHEEHEGFNIGAILRIVPIKDVKTLIRAFKLVKSEIPNVKLYLIGPYDEDMEYYEECLKLVKNLELEENIKFTGKVDIKKYLKRLDLLILTSISEGQPLVILEGMACEIPFVATDVGSCKELLEGKEDDNIGLSGIITSPVSPNDTANAIIRLLKDKKLRTQMSQNGRERVEKYYTNRMFIEKYNEVYESLR
ncbi:GT4 family glycosyltransferase PelF [Tepidibacter hydrothermalis]|uniref:GT4 family glycosyltransferase PelF n=1 Tax=Tepidibacter hydrothermalis TaxID=3036126 RepID=A0ABY8EGZ4_9FIRM|nr:GT4 family glycosyltransferase PelF [Tepidibacter hydrothermalis]WFD11125.1 GT4 family glycosyltransferase PelF [Tepidibacter hydrothermalis]